MRLSSEARAIAGIPGVSAPVPEVVAALAGGVTIEPVWFNEVGGRTFQLGDGRFVKWSPRSAGVDLREEVDRLGWAVAYTEVPRVLDFGEDGSAQWMVTTAIAGTSAVAARWLGEPRTAAQAIGAGLRAMHDSLPVADCPFEWGVESRIAHAEQRIVAGDGPATWSSEHQHLTVVDARARLADPPDVIGQVVCHGDACAPNTLLAEDGTWLAHVDLGRLGVADPWADLAIATWSLEWNYGPGHDAELLGAYGVEPDPERTAYYRLLWDLS